MYIPKRLIIEKFEFRKKPRLSQLQWLQLEKNMIIESNNFLDWWKCNHIYHDVIYFDIDGTLMSGTAALPGAIELIELLERDSVPFIFLTNDGYHSTEMKAERFKNAGFDINSENIISCGNALEYVVGQKNLYDCKFFLMGGFGNPLYTDACNLTVTREISDLDGCNGVIIGEMDYDWQSAINAVTNFFINNPKASFIIPNPDSYWPTGNRKEIHIGSGGVARFILTILQEYGLNIEPIYLGKPYQAIYNHTIQVLRNKYSNCYFNDIKRILVVGDSLKSDIDGANRMGYTSTLLLTGITNEEHLRQQTEIIPDLVFRSIG